MTVSNFCVLNFPLLFEGSSLVIAGIFLLSVLSLMTGNG